MSEIKKLTADVDVEEYYKNYVDFEKFSKLCIEEQEMLGYNWSYPPFDFDVDEIYVLENQDSQGLFLGKCNLCMKCTREFGMQCKMPFKMRYPLEALGADVDRTVEDIFGLKIQYAHDGKLPEYLMFVGGLLYERK